MTHVIRESPQLGLSFDEPEEQNVSSEPECHWLEPEYTIQSYRDRVQHIANNIGEVVPSELRDRFLEGLDLARESIDALAETVEDGDQLTLPASKLDIGAQIFDNILAVVDSASTSGCEVRVRRQYWYSGAGIYHKDAGALIAQKWRDGGFHAAFVLNRPPFFNLSFRESSPRLPLAAKWWDPFCACQRVSTAGHIPAVVPAFKVGGQFYVHLSNTSYGDGFRECEAWTVMAVEDWKVRTFTRDKLGKAWDSGRVERGNVRGLVVCVNGHLCALDRHVIFEDHCQRRLDQ